MFFGGWQACKREGLTRPGQCILPIGSVADGQDMGGGLSAPVSGWGKVRA
ncbi:hypothetical protein VAWG004_41470 [Aeromonas veronii]|nr:hypothetical protein VAWG004_41470 [Aeromonas veronii]